MIKEQNLELIRGDSYSLPYELTDSSGAYDLTDCELRFTVKKNYNDSDADAMIGPKLLTITDATEGKALLELTAEDTDLQLGNYFYDVQLSNNDELVKTTVRGVLSITWDTTRINGIDA